MSLERHRLKPESLRINVKIFIGNEEEVVLPCSPELSEFGKNNRFPDHQNVLEPGKKIIDNAGCRIFTDIVGLRIHPDKSIIPGIDLLPECKALVWRVDSEALIRERRRHELGHEHAQTGQCHFVLLKNNIPYHFSKKIDIHNEIMQQVEFQ